MLAGKTTKTDVAKVVKTEVHGLNAEGLISERSYMKEKACGEKKKINWSLNNDGRADCKIEGL